MNDTEQALVDAELAIRSGDAAKAADTIAILEKIVESATSADVALQDHRVRIRRLIALSVAAAEGTAAAHRWLEGALKLANTLETYTADGRRVVDIVPAVKSERF